MKKIKRAVAMNSHLGFLQEDPKIRFKHQSLLQDYEDLKKETEAMKIKLLNVKQKKLTLSAEVRFLKRRYEYLTKNQSINHLPKHDYVQPHKFEMKTTNIKKGKHYSKKEPALKKPLAPSNLNRKGGIYKGIEEAPLQKSTPSFDLNQKARTFNGKKATVQNSSPKKDLNQKERMHGGKEAGKRSMTPVFDLNQISREEEQQANYERSRVEEPNENLVKCGNDEQNNYMKISVCRDIGSGGSNRAKRKISWQDQVALRV